MILTSLKPSLIVRLTFAALSLQTTASVREVSICDPTGNRTPVSAVRGQRPSR